MGKARRGPHLLEAFRSVGGEEGRGLPARATPARREPSVSPPGRPWELALGERPCVLIGLSAGSLAAVVSAAVGLAVVLFAVGRATAPVAETGEASAADAAGVVEPASGTARREALPPAVGPGEATAEPPAPTGTVTPVYTVRVITYGPGQSAKAEEFALFLRNQGFRPEHVVVRPAGRDYVVYAGRFPSRDDEVALEGLKLVKELRYPKSDFSSASIVELPQ